MDAHTDEDMNKKTYTRELVFVPQNLAQMGIGKHEVHQDNTGAMEVSFHKSGNFDICPQPMNYTLRPVALKLEKVLVTIVNKIYASIQA